MKTFKFPLAVILLTSLAGCVDPNMPEGTQVPYVKHDIKYAPVLEELKALEAPKRKINISVYNFPDLTGAFKPNENFATYSKAVPQGAEAMIVDALISAGNGSWFDVTERQGLQSLVQERKIIEVALNDEGNRQKVMNNLVNRIKQGLEQKINQGETPASSGTHNQAVLAPGKGEGILANPQNQVANNLVGRQSQPAPSMQNIPTQAYIPSLLPSEYIIEGGVIGYDSDVVTSGAGLKLMNIGGFGEVRKDTVSVNMRLVNVNTGKVIVSTTLTKGIYSQKLQGSGMGYVALDRILEGEAGIGYNEPVFEALNLTIQSGVLDIIKKGQEKKIW